MKEPLPRPQNPPVNPSEILLYTSVHYATMQADGLPWSSGVRNEPRLWATGSEVALRS
jgi:hypothetical protein